MIMPLIRKFLCRFYRRFVFSKSDQLDENQLNYSAIVFAPHQDDETLGCGGAIIQKKRAGADIKIVFMTDGSTSHSHLISKDELKNIRTNEALAACKVLGLVESDVVFLEYEDGRLQEYRASATDKVEEILRRQTPEEIFVPYYREPTPDHVATNEIIISAVQSWQKKVTIYEYPVWAWYHWPWVSVPIGRGHGAKLILINSLKAWFGVRILRDFRSYMAISDVREQKRTALDQHRSQMSRLIPDPNWLILDDIANGEFLECFFQEIEIFRHYQLE